MISDNLGLLCFSAQCNFSTIYVSLACCTATFVLVNVTRHEDIHEISAGIRKLRKILLSIADNHPFFSLSHSLLCANCDPILVVVSVYTDLTLTC